MNYGDVGRILRLLPYWIAIFKATGKSKYSAHMIRFMTDLDHVYPPRLRYVQMFRWRVLSRLCVRNLVLRNWMCNLTGKPDGWRGWDWLQERNNLYTKVTQSYVCG